MTTMSKSTSAAWESKYKGLTSIPTDTKNRTANVSRNGTISAPTWWLSADSLITTPARKAPSARETPKTDEAPIAVPTVITTIATMKSCRERWEQYKNEDCNQILQHQPADSHLPMRGTE